MGADRARRGDLRLPTRKRVALYLERVKGHWESGLCDVPTRRAMRRAAPGARAATAGPC